MLAEFSERFPEVMLPLIHERDVYLAWSLSRSKAVRAMCLVQELFACIAVPSSVMNMQSNTGLSHAAAGERQP
jgi:pheromone shutdown protein TraB